MIFVTMYEKEKDRIRAHLLQKIHQAGELQVEDEKIQEQIDEAVNLTGKEMYLSLIERKRMGKELFYELRKLDVVQELLEQEDITEIMINGMEGIFVEKQGKITRYKKEFRKKEILEDVIQRMVATCNRVVNESVPIVDARLEDGSRVHIILYPIALNGPIVTIRKFSKHPMQMSDLIKFEAISEQVAGFLQDLVVAGYNIFISGGTGAGKTTFLNALSQWIPAEERVITIEDSAELQLNDTPNLVRLETRNANLEGCMPITIRDLMKASLRMRPDRIIVGEVRGAEAVDMIQCLNTGHDGSLSTGHANSAKDMLSRLETMMLMGIDLPLAAIRRQIASGIDIIVHLGRMRDKTRKVIEIVEIVGMKEGEIEVVPLYTFIEENLYRGKVKGCLVKMQDIKNTKKLSKLGIVEKK